MTPIMMPTSCDHFMCTLLYMHRLVQLFQHALQVLMFDSISKAVLVFLNSFKVFLLCCNQEP